MITITSAHNDRVKQMVRLHTKKERERTKQFLVEGLRAINGFLEAGWQPKELWITESLYETCDLPKNISIILVTDSIAKKISQSSTPSGVIGIFDIPATPPPNTLSHGIVLYELSDPGNIGTLIRTAAALKAESVVIIGGVDPYSHKVVQASAGSLARVKLFRWTVKKLLAAHKALPLYALVPEGGVSPSQQPLDAALLILGNEAHGLPLSVIDNCSGHITLPMPGDTESLNAAIAGSIALYSAWMQRSH